MSDPLFLFIKPNRIRDRISFFSVQRISRHFSGVKICVVNQRKTDFHKSPVVFKIKKSYFCESNEEKFSHIESKGVFRIGECLWEDSENAMINLHNQRTYVLFKTLNFT